MTPTQNDELNELSTGKKTSVVRFLPIILASLAILGFVGVVWYAYKQGKSGHYQDVAPTIKADFETYKERPENPGGMQIPNQDRFIFRQLEEGDGETLFVEEAPVVTPSEPASGTMESADVQAEETLRAMQQEAEKAVDAYTPPPASPPAPVPAAEPVSQPKPVEQARKNDMLTAPSKSVLAQYRVQLLSVRDEAAANKGRADLEKKLKSVMNPGQRFYVVPADLGAKGMYYRVQVGDFANKEEADALCTAVKATGGSCLVVKQ